MTDPPDPVTTDGLLHRRSPRRVRRLMTAGPAPLPP